MSVFRIPKQYGDETLKDKHISTEGDKRETRCRLVGGVEEQKGSVVSREGWNKIEVATHLEKLIGRTLELDSRHSSNRKG